MKSWVEYLLLSDNNCTRSSSGLMWKQTGFPPSPHLKAAVSRIWCSLNYLFFIQNSSSLDNSPTNKQPSCLHDYQSWQPAAGQHPSQLPWRDFYSRWCLLEMPQFSRHYLTTQELTISVFAVDEAHLLGRERHPVVDIKVRNSMGKSQRGSRAVKPHKR